MPDFFLKLVKCTVYDPSPGFTTKFNSPSIDISGKVLIDSHIQLSANTKTDRDWETW